MAIGPQVARTVPLQVATEAGRIGRDPVLARLARAADPVGPANSGQPVRDRTAGAGTALVGTAAPGTAGARNTAVAAGAHRHETAHLAGPRLGEVSRPAIRRVARGPAATVRPATQAGPARPPATPAGPARPVARGRPVVARPANHPVAQGRAATHLTKPAGPADPESPVDPGLLPSARRPARRVGVGGSGPASGRAADRFAGVGRRSRDPGQLADPAGHGAPRMNQGLDHRTADPASQPSDRANAVPAAGPGQQHAASVAPTWGSVGCGHQRPADTAAVYRGNPAAARLNSQLLPIRTNNDAGQNLGCPDWSSTRTPS
jgi:hypothetical protein